jgi:hypothetical protein
VCWVIEKWLQAPVPGIFQLSGPRDVSYAEVADYIARKIGADPALVQRVSAYSAGLPEGSTARNTTLDSSQNGTGSSCRMCGTLLMLRLSVAA